MLSSCVSRSDVTCAKSHVFSMRRTHVYTTQRQNNNGGRREICPFVAGNTVIILSYLKKNSLQTYKQIKLKWICIFKTYSSISVQPKSDLLKFIVIKNATDLEWQQQVWLCCPMCHQPRGQLETSSLIHSLANNVYRCEGWPVKWF